MMINQTLEKLRQLKLTGMAKGYEDQLAMPDAQTLSFDNRLGILVDTEQADRFNRRYQSRMRVAKLRENAAIEDLDFSQSRGIDKNVILSLAHCEWVKAHQNVLITGPTGVGKTYLACALTQRALREGYSAKYLRVPRLFQDLLVAKAEGRYSQALASIARQDILVLDDWGLSTLNGEQRRDFLEIIEERMGLRSTVITSQLPCEEWFEVIGDPTIADAILDRLIHVSHRINLKGDSMRKKKMPKK